VLLPPFCWVCPKFVLSRISTPPFSAVRFQSESTFSIVWNPLSVSVAGHSYYSPFAILPSTFSLLFFRFFSFYSCWIFPKPRRYPHGARYPHAPRFPCSRSLLFPLLKVKMTLDFNCCPEVLLPFFPVGPLFIAPIALLPARLV